MNKGRVYSDSKFPLPSTRSCLSLAAQEVVIAFCYSCFIALGLVVVILLDPSTQKKTKQTKKKTTYQDEAFEAAFTSNSMNKFYWRTVENVAWLHSMKLNLPDFLYFYFVSFPSMFMKQDSGIKRCSGSVWQSSINQYD